MQLEIEATSVLKQTLENSKTKIICHQGSSRSSKTWSIFQYFLIKAMQGDSFVLTIARAKLTWVKSTLLKDFEEMTRKYNIPVYPEININRQEQVYKMWGSEIAFFGLDYPEKLHGRKQDYTWLNEVMEVDKKSFDQLEMRTTKQMIIDYNPAYDDHWVFELHKRPDVVVIKSTFKDNPFLEQVIVDKLLSYEPTAENIARGTADNYMWEVYGLGNKARLQGAIFTNWRVVSEVPQTARLLGIGIDFGYTNDPTAILELYQQDNELYLSELEYKTGMTNQDIADRLESLEIARNILIVGDSSEPKSIEEIRRKGFAIKGATKGADSIVYGIDLIKQYKLNITEKSINLENELRKYKWREDKNGKSMNVPIDDYNHAIDSFRYIASETLKTRAVVKIINRGSFGL